MATAQELKNWVEQHNIILDLPNTIVNTGGVQWVAFAQQIKRNLQSNDSVEDIIKKIEDNLGQIYTKINDIKKSVAGGLIFKGALPNTLSEIKNGYTYVVTDVKSPIHYKTLGEENTYSVLIPEDEVIEPGDIVIVTHNDNEPPKAIVIQKNIDTSAIDCGTYEVPDIYTQR